MEINEAMRQGLKIIKKPDRGSWSCFAIGTIIAVGQGQQIGIGLSSVLYDQSVPQLKERMRDAWMPQVCSAECWAGSIEFFHAMVNGVAFNKIPLFWFLSHLFEGHKWSCEAIAEWADPRPELHIGMPCLMTPGSEAVAPEPESREPELVVVRR